MSRKDQLDLFGSLLGSSADENRAGTKSAPEAASAPNVSHATIETSHAQSMTAPVKAPRKSRSKKASPVLEPDREAAIQNSEKSVTVVRDAGKAGAVAVRATEKAVSLPLVKKPLVAEPEESDEPTVMSVGDLNKHIREILEGRFPLLWLKAEISNFKAHTSGHFYFSLKDSRAQISAVMFRGFNQHLRFRPEDGMEVLVRGKITVYEPRGNYQIFCEMMEPVGAGALQKAYEQLKARLQKEGLFDQARKRPLPAHPRHIAIVTSPTGAAIRDMLNVLGRRAKGVHITVIPCKVQGDAAPGEIVEAIKLAQKLKDIDVMIVGRGGGSIEDLWAFNDERVARAIVACRVPVISAVGHEVDFTIADFVADLRAPTPSAAAELVVANAADLIHRLTNLGRALKLALFGRLQSSQEQIQFLSRRLVDPQRMLQDASIRCDELMQRLEMSLRRELESRVSDVKLLRSRLGTPQARIDRARDRVGSDERRLGKAARALVVGKRQALTKNMAVLDSLSPLKVLDRGFSMVTVGEKIVTQAKDLKPGDAIHVRMCEGSVEAEVKSVNKDAR